MLRGFVILHVSVSVLRELSKARIALLLSGVGRADSNNARRDVDNMAPGPFVGRWKFRTRPRNRSHPMTFHASDSNSWRSSTDWSEHVGQSPGAVLVLTKTTPYDGCGRIATDTACRPIEYLGAFAVELRGDQSGRPSTTQRNAVRAAVKELLFGHVSRCGVPRYAR